LTITEVSRKFDISQDTLRYYERVGLLPHVNRNKSGIRDYTEEDCNGWNLSNACEVQAFRLKY
jgi:DNA-binding transcriptional MerR regulator